MIIADASSAWASGAISAANSLAFSNVEADNKDAPVMEGSEDVNAAEVVGASKVVVASEVMEFEFEFEIEMEDVLELEVIVGIAEPISSSLWQSKICDDNLFVLEAS